MDSKANVNYYWGYVKEHYPDARFDFWFKWGELHFYPNAEAEYRDEVMALLKENGKYVFKSNF